MANNPVIMMMVIINNRRRPTGPKSERMPCQSGENSRAYTRLSRQEITALAHEFKRWRHLVEGVAMKYCSAEKRVEGFLQYLAATTPRWTLGGHCGEHCNGLHAQRGLLWHQLALTSCEFCI